MRITILEVVRTDTGLEVAFDSAIGEGRGHWMSGAIGVGDTRHVELESNDTLVLGVSAWQTQTLEPSMGSRPGGVEITARLDAKHPEEQTLSFSLGDGRLDVEAESVSEFEQGCLYTMTIATPSLYDMDL